MVIAGMDRETKTQLKVRLPADVKEWIERQVAKNASSQNSEIVRAVRERMDRESKPAA